LHSQSIHGKLAKSNRGAEDRRGSAFDIGLDDLGNINSDQLIALRGIKSEEVAQLREEESNLSFSLSVAQPGLVGGEDPLAKLAFGAGLSSLQRTERMVKDVLLSTSGDGGLSNLAVTESGAHLCGRSASSEQTNNAGAGDELGAHTAGASILNRGAGLAQLGADGTRITETNGGSIGKGGEEHALCREDTTEVTTKKTKQNKTKHPNKTKKQKKSAFSSLNKVLLTVSSHQLQENIVVYKLDCFGYVRAHPMRLNSTSGKRRFWRAAHKPILEQMVRGG
jgi:hypothetical protein